MINRIRPRAQTIIEYIILLAIVVGAVGAMKMYLLRSVKAQFKVMQERISDPDAYSERSVDTEREEEGM